MIVLDNVETAISQIFTEGVALIIVGDKLQQTSLRNWYAGRGMRVKITIEEMPGGLETEERSDDCGEGHPHG